MGPLSGMDIKAIYEDDAWKGCVKNDCYGLLNGLIIPISISEMFGDLSLEISIGRLVTQSPSYIIDMTLILGWSMLWSACSIPIRRKKTKKKDLEPQIYIIK